MVKGNYVKLHGKTIEIRGVELNADEIEEIHISKSGKIISARTIQDICLHDNVEVTVSLESAKKVQKDLAECINKIENHLLDMKTNCFCGFEVQSIDGKGKLIFAIFEDEKEA